MKIDRERVINVFASYVKNYNDQDEKVKLKIEHTYRVSELCEEIAKSIHLSQEDLDLAWLTGILHDVGRFEQLRMYGTFNDALSVDHAALGADILFRDGMIRQFVNEEDADALLEKAVRCHSAYRIPDSYSERETMFSNIVRDADKIDILKVNVEVPLEEIYNVTTKDIKTSQVTAEVMDAFYEHRAILRSLKRTAVDHVVGHISLVYELFYPVSVTLVKKQGYLDQLLHFTSENEKTKEQFAEIRKEMETFLCKAALQ